MDPVTAFSLAGTILQFLDSGSRFIKLAHELYRAQGDTLTSLTDLHAITIAFQQELQDFNSSNINYNHAESQQDNIAQLAHRCEEVLVQLLTLVGKLNDATHHRKQDALKRAFQMILKENEIKTLMSRLNDFRSEFSFHLLTLVRSVNLPLS